MGKVKSIDYREYMTTGNLIIMIYKVASTFIELPGN